ncbi:MAG: hypothetical protein A3I66_10090 [Burkholderiales bacterium RIFCSPLOWO2_02_FULL_57_36]|nr:MAG: hypothetical protein A3I66_10090 [Burkholderiales bacterium RIFCSPLOWO2_02_FULL_57_36]
MVEFLINYAPPSQTAKSAKVTFEMPANFDCKKNALPTVEVNVSPLTPQQGRLTQVPKDWSERLGLSLILVVIGYVIRGFRIGT